MVMRLLKEYCSDDCYDDEVPIEETATFFIPLMLQYFVSSDLDLAAPSSIDAYTVHLSLLVAYVLASSLLYQPSDISYTDSFP